MASSFYAQGAFVSIEDYAALPDLSSSDARAAEEPADAKAAPAEPERAATNGSGEAVGAGTPGGMSFASFYKRSGGGVNGPTVVSLPWTRRGRSAGNNEDNAAERSDSRERRHRSSWHAALNKRIVAIEDAEELLVLVNELLNGCDMLNTITIINRFSRLRGAPRMQRDPRVLEVLYRIEAWLARTGCQDPEEDYAEIVCAKHLASITTALARLRWKDSTAGRILRQVASVGPSVLKDSRARDLSNLAWAYATLEMREFDMLLLAIAREAVVQIADFTEQNLSNTCWAYAKLGCRHDPLIKAIADETIRKLPFFSPQGLVNTIWGFATLIIKGEEILGQSSYQLICSLLEEIMRRLPDLTTQLLSNSSWACCRLGVRHEEFMAAIAQQGTMLMDSYTPQDLSNTAMAFAKPNIQNRAFLQRMAERALVTLQRFEAREVSNFTWSLMIMGNDIVSPQWIDRTLEHFAMLIGRGEYEGWEMVQLLNAIWVHRASLSQWPQLEATFRRSVYAPVVRSLLVIIGREAQEVREEQQAPVISAGPLSSWVPRREEPDSPLEAARREAQRIVQQLEVDFLGPVFTRAALRDLGFVDPADTRHADAFRPTNGGTPVAEHADRVPPWAAHARAEVSTALDTLKRNLPFMWFDRFGPHERRVMCWVAYRLEVELPGHEGSPSPRETLSEDGRIADFSLDEHRALHKHGEETFARLEALAKGELWFSLQDVRQAQQWMQGLFAQHDRGGHAERQALLEVVLEVVGAVRRLQGQVEKGRGEACLQGGFFDGSMGAVVRGHLRLFVCHFFCISCVAAVSIFQRRFPQVTIHCDYDNCWETRLLDV